MKNGLQDRATAPPDLSTVEVRVDDALIHQRERHGGAMMLVKTVLFLMAMQSPPRLRGCGNLQSVDRPSEIGMKILIWEIKIKKTKRMQQPHLKEVNNVEFAVLFSCGGRKY